DHMPAGLAHTETQVNVLGAVKNPLVQESQLRQSRPANDLTRADDIIDLAHAIMIPVGHLRRTAVLLGESEGETASELVTHGREKSTGELEPALEINQFRATHTDIRVCIHVGKQPRKHPGSYQRIVIQQDD